MHTPTSSPRGAAAPLLTLLTMLALGSAFSAPPVRADDGAAERADGPGAAPRAAAERYVAALNAGDTAAAWKLLAEESRAPIVLLAAAHRELFDRAPPIREELGALGVDRAKLDTLTDEALARDVIFEGILAGLARRAGGAKAIRLEPGIVHLGSFAYCDLRLGEHAGKLHLELEAFEWRVSYTGLGKQIRQKVAQLRKAYPR